MKMSAYIGGLVGLAVLVYLGVHAHLGEMLDALRAGGPPLLWLIPYRAIFFALYAVGWLALLSPRDPEKRVGFGYILWATAVRDAVDRLLPVASVGGSVVGVRILQWRGVPGAAVAASVIVEILLTLIVVYLFTALGIILLVECGGASAHEYRRLVLVFLLSMPVPVVLGLLLKNGAAARLLQRLIRSLGVEGALFRGMSALDEEIRGSLHRPRGLLTAGTLQLLALLSGAFEIWFPLKLFAHPVSITAALMLESMTQAVRHLAFVVPAGLGVQEAGLVVFGHAVGVSGELALAVAMVKRVREVAWGVPTLLSWQWQEGRRLRRA
jgi:putative membrane protein